MSRLQCLLAGLMILFAPQSILGADTDVSEAISEKVEIHGFGGWAVGDTDGNRYLFGAEGRGYDARSFALHVTAEPSEQLSISFQGIYEPPLNNPETIEADLDYGFAQWTFSESLKLRGGVVKTPFGVYAEIFDVGTARPFFDLPQGMYGPSEIVAKAYFGMGLTGTTGDSWELQYDVYGGEMELDATSVANPLIFGGEEEGEEGEQEALFVALKAGGGGEEGGEAGESTKLVDMIGGRLTVYAPVFGLSFGVSAFTGEPEVEGGGPAPPSQEVYAAHVEYFTDRWTVRAETAYRNGGKRDLEVDASYLEVAYQLNANWQFGARYDEGEIDAPPGVEVRAPSLLEHQDLAVGVNYWFSPGLVLKLAYHDVDGNLFAIPGRNPRVLEEKGLNPSTELVKFGIQFSF